MSFLVVLALPSLASAAKYGAAGCGLGSVIMGKDAGFSQVLAASTNNSFFGVQTWGILLGTSNCEDEPQQQASLERSNFVAANRASMNRDAVSGGGEYIAAYAEILGCGAEAPSRLAQLAQQRHAQLFAGSTSDVVTQFDALVASDASLSAACNI